MDIGKWGWRLVFKGKHKNKAACAVGRKLLTYSWHIMRGDPSPNRGSEAFFKRKMVRFYSEPGVNRMKELGFASRNAGGRTSCIRSTRSSRSRSSRRCRARTRTAPTRCGRRATWSGSGRWAWSFRTACRAAFGCLAALGCPAIRKWWQWSRMVALVNTAEHWYFSS